MVLPVLAGALWVAIAALVWGDRLGAHLVELVCGLGLITAVPLGLAASAAGARPSRFRTIAELSALPLGAVAAGSLVRHPSAVTGAIAAVWVVPATAAALWGVSRIARRGLRPIEELAIDAGLIYLPVGALWLIAGRAGATPLGFVEPLVTLTAIHFTYAGFGAAVFAGVLGRCLPPSRVYDTGALAAVAAVPVVALGIWLSPALELAGALALAAGLMALAACGLKAAHFALESATSRALVAAASTALLFSMSCAAIFAAGELRGEPLLSIAEMVDLHGVVNALAFVIAGLAGLALAAPAPRHDGSRAPFSRLAGAGPIGADFFDRIGAVVGRSNPPRGLIDSLDDYARPELNPQFVDLAIRRFYEKTGDYAICVVPRWRWFARPAAALWRRFSRRVGQLGLPFDPVSDGEMNSELAWLEGAVDGRDHPRGWVRTYAATGEVVYAAAYATHETDGVPYMNIAFPLPRGNMSSILRVDFHGGGGLAVTTLPAGRDSGDEGVFWVAGDRALRLPVNETIYVVARREATRLGLSDPPEGAAGATVVARHDLWIFGLKVLELEYWLTPRSR